MYEVSEVLQVLDSLCACVINLIDVNRVFCCPYRVEDAIVGVIIITCAPEDPEIT